MTEKKVRLVVRECYISVYRFRKKDLSYDVLEQILFSLMVS